MPEKIAAIVPAYNEEGKISKVVRRVLAEKRVDRMIVVDDGSSDQTVREAESSGAQVIRQPKNMGVGAAIRAGLDFAKANGFTVALILGGDDQDNPDEMHRILDAIEKDGCDFVQGSRYLPGGATENIPLFRLVTTSIFSILIRSLLWFPVTDGTNGFRAFRLSLLDHPKLNTHQEWLNRYELEPYLYYKAIALGMKVKEVPVTKRYPKNKVGYTKMIPFVSWWSILRPLIFLRLGIKK